MSGSPIRSVEVGGFERDFLDATDLGDLSAAARRVLAASAALFYRYGAVATSVRDITRSCGLTPGALYSHFASKDDVLFRIVTHGHDALERRVCGVRASAAAEPAAQYTAFVRAYVTAHLVQPELAQVVRREYVHLTPRRVTQIVRRRRGVRDELSGLVRDGVDAGVLTLVDDGTPTALAVMVLDMCSRTSEWYDRSGSAPPDEVADRYVAAALRLAGARP